MTAPTRDATHSVGHVHVLDAAGGLCVETCPHPEHTGPVIVAIPTALKPLLDEWLHNLDLAATFMPTEPDDFDGLRAYTVPVGPGHPLLAPSPLEGRMRPAAGPRKGKARR